ncbi:hypothetical protein ACN20G_34655 (plasmid) [Streptomyces sp. BI20]|uniref:hypothetical protein n=1 Tax=Streptomyces sp. BI20 TaxID=3403460 RepID=UPI003C77096B
MTTAAAAVAALALAAAPVAASPDPPRTGGRGWETVCSTSAGPPHAERTVRLPAGAAAALLRSSPSYPGPCAEYGPALPLGAGTLRAYAQREGGRPLALGFTFPAAALRDLPTAVGDGRHCFDRNEDGRFDLATECSVGHEHVLELPAGFRRHVDTPFSWGLVNWNPQGHIPIGVYNVPHFDFHFYLRPKAESDAIRPGPCPALVNCEDYARAKKPLPARHLPPDYVDVDAVEPAMGNHLVDSTSPELHHGGFTHTMLFGTYDARVTFLEPMITKAWFTGLREGTVRDACFPVKQPAAWRTAGWYPTSYCINHRADRDEYRVALTGFVHRPAG